MDDRMDNFADDLNHIALDQDFRVPPEVRAPGSVWFQEIPDTCRETCRTPP